VARAEYVRPFFEVRYDVSPSSAPGLEYTGVDLCYWEQRVAIGDHGVSVLDEGRVIEESLDGVVLALAMHRAPGPGATPAAVGLRPSSGLEPGRTAVLGRTVLSRGSLPGASERDDTAPLRDHLLDHLVVRFEADLVLAFGSPPDRRRALAEARRRWRALAPGPDGVDADPDAIVRAILFDDVADLVRDLQG